MTFDWRNYVNLDKSILSYFYGEDGSLKARFDDDYGRARAEAMKSVIGTIERTLDQIDDIPEVQELLKNGLLAAHLRAEQYKEMYGDAMPEDVRVKITVSLDGGRTMFQMDKNEIHINAGQIVNTSYLSTDGQMYPFSVQGALIDELHHWADSSLTPQRDFDDHFGVLKGVIDKVLSDFPEYREQYEKERTIAGMDFSAMDEIRNGEELNSFIKKITPWAQLRVRQSSIDEKGARPAFEERYELYADMPEYEQLMIGGYITQIYGSESYDLRERLDEVPAVNTHNAIVGERFGLPPRDGYNATEEPSSLLMEYDEVAKQFAERAEHQILSEDPASDVVPDSGLVQPPPAMAP